jgi:hypothetical protein
VAAPDDVVELLAALHGDPQDGDIVLVVPATHPTMPLGLVEHDTDGHLAVPVPGRASRPERAGHID